MEPESEPVKKLPGAGQKWKGSATMNLSRAMDTDLHSFSVLDPDPEGKIPEFKKKTKKREEIEAGCQCCGSGSARIRI